MRLFRRDDGQSLTEYALILALVSLAAIVALGFLSGKVNGLFSKAGNSLNTVQFADGAVGNGAASGAGAGSATGSGSGSGSATGTGTGSTGSGATGTGTTGTGTTGTGTTGTGTTGTTGTGTTGTGATGTGSTTTGTGGTSTTGTGTTGTGTTGTGTTGTGTTGTGTTGTGTTGTGGGGSTPPTDNGSIGSNPGIVTSGVPGGAIWNGSTGSSLFNPGQAVPSNSAPSSATCSISFNNGNTFTFNGTWVPDPPGVSEPIWNPSNNSTNYHWACIANSWRMTPTSGTSFSQGKSFGDNLIDGGTYYSAGVLNAHSGASANGAGVFATDGNGEGSGTRAFYFTSAGFYVCTWESDIGNGNGSSPHWQTVGSTHSSNENGTRYTQRCAMSA